MVLRGRQHVVEQLPVGGLDGGALGERAPRLGDAAGEGITELLELAEIEHPRRARRADPVRHVDPAEARGHQATELELEPPDLPAQLRPREALVDRDSVEHSPHSRSLSRLEGRGGDP
ncbi:MAG TPA: hypothetical protein VHB53_14020 [Solirubrobacterales bacterium]|nr:hypothetical protein [Solirubrobacterales bacterium]